MGISRGDESEGCGEEVCCCCCWAGVNWVNLRDEEREEASEDEEGVSGCCCCKEGVSSLASCLTLALRFWNQI